VTPQQNEHFEARIGSWPFPWTPGCNSPVGAITRCLRSNRLGESALCTAVGSPSTCHDLYPYGADSPDDMWFVRIRDPRTNGPDATFSLQVRSWATAPLPTETITLDGPSLFVNISLGETRFLWLDARGVVRPNRVSLRFTNENGDRDGFAVVVGKPFDPQTPGIAVPGDGICGTLRGFIGAPAQILWLEACQIDGALLPLSITHIRNSSYSVFGSHTLRLQIVATEEPPVTTTSISLNVPRFWQFSTTFAPMVSLALPSFQSPYADLVFTASNIIDHTAATDGARVALYSNRQAPNQWICYSSRAENQCSRLWSHVSIFDDLSKFSSVSGDNRVFFGAAAYQCSSPLNVSFTGRVSVMEPRVLAVRGGTEVDTGSLQAGEAILYQYAAPDAPVGRVTVDSVSCSEGLELYKYVLDSSGVKSRVGSLCKALPGANGAENVTCNSGLFFPASCIDSAPKFVRVWNRGSAACSFRFGFVPALPATRVITPGSTHVFSSLSVNDYQSLSFVTGRSEAIRVQAEMFPNVGSFRYEFELRRGCQRVGNRIYGRPALAPWSVLVDDPSQATAGLWSVAVVRTDRIFGELNVSITVEVGPSIGGSATCIDFSAVEAAPFCNATRPTNATVSHLTHYGRNRDISAHRDFLILRESLAVSTPACLAMIEELSCRYHFSGCNPASGLLSEADRCRELCESAISQCVNASCASAYCSQLPACPPVSATTGVDPTTGQTTGSSTPTTGSASSASMTTTGAGSLTSGVGGSLSTSAATADDGTSSAPSIIWPFIVIGVVAVVCILLAVAIVVLRKRWQDSDSSQANDLRLNAVPAGTYTDLSESASGTDSEIVYANLDDLGSATAEEHYNTTDAVNSAELPDNYQVISAVT
jgi:hypothetical protein